MSAAPEKPTYAAFEETQRKIFACASSITSLSGGGQHDELGLFMNPSAYDLLALAITYICPVHPGDPLRMTA